MGKTLGLDLGTNSIGWAMVDNENNSILGMGSRIFPEGVVNLGEGNRETSKNASRTGDRGIRRQIYRRRLRKIYLLKILSKNKLCPISYSDVKFWNSSIFDDPKLIDWFKLNPYRLRANAVSGRLELEELGRVFYHMIQRRGFQTNSRSGGDEEGKIYEGKNSEGKIGILETQERLKGQTLGTYLNSIYPVESYPYKQKDERIRNRYTTRKMYIDEFEKIWEKQCTFHPELSAELKAVIGGRKKDGYSEDGVLFFQRPLRSQKHLIGNCTFESSKPKCPRSAIPFEYFRIYQWVNTVECDNKKLNVSEREKVVNFLLRKDKPKFNLIRKVLSKSDSYYQFNYKDDDKIVGSHTISNLSNKKYFGESWFNFTEKQQEDIWHVLFSFDDKERLKKYAIGNWGFTEEQAIKISKFHLVDGYANLSRKAINNILPFLKRGYTYDLAVVLGGIKNAFGPKWSKLNEDEIQFIIDNTHSIVRAGWKGGFIEILKEFLTGEYQLSKKDLDKLYHHSANIKSVKILDKLPVGSQADKEIQAIRNPVVITALFEIRKVVNEIVQLYGKPDEIKIELARDLKVSKTKRNDIRREQKRLESENDRIKKELETHHQLITHESILKFKLWEECDNRCPYTGREIGLHQLFSGEVQIEHIHPWSKSLNDSFMNKTLCFADENRAKGDRTPYEYYYKEFGEEKWETIKYQALGCFKNKKNYPNAYHKFKHFVKKKHDDDFISRQLNDTRYISREAKSYLSKICENVMVAPGQMTANLRAKWGLNNILSEESKKNRDDHRHHAIDALIMSCSTVSHLQALSKWNRYRRGPAMKDFPVPWKHFFEDAKDAVENILVSHKKNNNVLTVRYHTSKKDGKIYRNKGVAARGQLHKEFVFGKRQAPQQEQAFHIRKPIESLSTRKQLEKIVDPIIRKLIYGRIEQLGGFEEKDKIPQGTFFSVDEEGKKIPEIYLPNKNGEPVPVKKVRMRENLGGAEQLKENINQYVNPRNNHHVLIYKDKEGNLKENVVTFWTAVERKKNNQSVVQLPDDGREIIATLQINDMFLLGLKEEDINWEKPDNLFLMEHLYRVQKLSSKFYEFRLHKESKLEKNTFPFYIRVQSFGDGKTGWNRFSPLKVSVSPTGKIKKSTR